MSHCICFLTRNECLNLHLSVSFLYIQSENLESKIQPPNLNHYVTFNAKPTPKVESLITFNDMNINPQSDRITNRCWQYGIIIDAGSMVLYMKTTRGGGLIQGDVYPYFENLKNLESEFLESLKLWVPSEILSPSSNIIYLEAS